LILRWQIAKVAEVKAETPRVASLAFDVPNWPGHLAGQHLDVRLTSEDGYQAQRSYSIASPPEDHRVAITVERLDDGEVSPYLVGELKAQDSIELRGPIGGSGVVPLMAMIRHRKRASSRTPARLLYSSRTFDDIIYREELDGLAASGDGLSVVHTLTRAQPAGWRGYSRRLDREMVDDVAWPVTQNPIVFVCGPTPFVEAAATLLVDRGYEPTSVKTERFGATGG